jgi:hypothetical protein
VKLIALRVAAFRRFAEPAAVEDFGAGVNVLAGPNEMGKSTLFHALEAAFLTRFKVSGAALDAMRPYAGGEPLVEADFEAEGRLWRIRKQFGRGAAAVLTDLAAKSDVARNADAEDRVAALTGRSGDLPGGLGLVWVRQQRSLQPPDPDIDPETGKEKARGERAVLRELIGREIEAAAAGDAIEFVRARTKRALDLLLTPTRAGIKKDGPLYHAQTLRDEAKTKRDEARAAAAAAVERLAQIAAMSERLAGLESSTTAETAQSRLAALEARRTAAVEARTRRDLAREAMKAREAELNVAQGAAASRRKLAEDREAKRNAAAVAQKLTETVEALATDLNADPATRAAVERLAELDRARAVAEAELAGHAATVDVRLEEGGKGRLKIGGAPLNESRRFAVVEPLEIRIDGIAAITVSTAQAARGTELKAKSASAAAEIETALRRLGVATIDDARAGAEARAAKVKELDAARTRLSELAPAGLGKLADDIAALDAALAAAGQPNLSEEDAARLKSAALEARATCDALEARALSDADLHALDGELAEARRAHGGREAEIKRLTIELANKKGEQVGIDETGRAAEVAARDGDFERAEAEAQRLRHEAEALKLLETTLADIEARAEAAYVAPISRRLTGHLARVFGASELSFKGDFAVDNLRRGDAREDVAGLSDGTREQLSVLVRLAFAEVLAESGKPAPLVLDDPLVYSDDERLAAVCGELTAAASVPQIILLTCRERAFEVLPGRRLKVTNWRPGRL